MKKVLAIILILCLLPGMTVFGSEDTALTDAEPAAEIDSPVGGYRMTGIISEAGDSLAIVSTAIDLGVDFYLFLNEDGTGAMSFLQASIPLKWDESFMIIRAGDDLDDLDDDIYDEDDDDLFDDEDDDEEDDVDELDEDDEPDDAFDDDGPIMIPYEYADGILKVRTSVYSMDFIRLTDEEMADYEENGGSTLSGLAGIVIENLISNTGIGDLVSDLVFDLAFGSMEPDPIIPLQEGEPSEGPVTGVVNNMEFTIVGAELVPMQDDYYTADELNDEYDIDNEDPDEDLDEDNDESDKWVITFYYNAKNISDELDCIWWYNFDADQDWDEEFMSWAYRYIPEEVGGSLRIAPGRTYRGATSFVCEPDDGVIGFRISAYEPEKECVTYYADTLNLGDAPEPYDYSADPSIPEYLAGLPDELDDIHVENAEFYVTEDGQDAVRFYFTFRNNTDTACRFPDLYNWYGIQDGIEVEWIRELMTEEEENIHVEVEPGEELLCATSFIVRTADPVAFVVTDVDEEEHYLCWVTEANDAAE